MKRIIAAMISAILALTMAACGDNGKDKTSDVSVSREDTSSEQIQIITTDGSELPKLRECLTLQLKAIADRDYEAFKKTLDAPLMTEVFFAIAEFNGDKLPNEEITEESLAETTKSVYYALCAAFAPGSESSISELTVQTDSAPTAGCHMYSASFKTADGKSCYAAVYEKDDRWGALIETDDDYQSETDEVLSLIADTNAALIGKKAEQAAEEYGAIPDGEYSFYISELSVTADPSDSVEAIKSAVAEAFDFEDGSDVGEMFMLVREGNIYVQWRSYRDPDIVGEYPTHEEEGFNAIWGDPAV